MTSQEVRKCYICKENIILAREDYFPERKGTNKITTRYCHTQCYTDKMLKKGLPIDVIEQFVSDCRDDFNKAQELKKQEAEEKAKQKLEQSRSKIKIEKSKREAIYNYITEHYSITYFPQSLKKHIDNILKGSSTILKPIPTEHLLEMWNMNQQFLDITAEKNRQKGKGMYGSSRIKYDLAILLDRYEKYLNWRDEKDNELALAAQEATRPHRYVKISEITPIRKPQKSKDVIDIASILDEI